MKRWVSGVLSLIMAMSFALGGFAFATEVEEGEAAAAQLAAVIEAPEAVDAPADPVEYEASLGDDPADETPADEPPADEPPVEQPAPAARRYAAVVAEAAPVCDVPGGTAFAVLSGGGVLVLEGAADWQRVAFYTERGVLTGWVAADCLNLLDDAVTATYLDMLAVSGVLALYEDDIDAPLELIACAFIDAEPELPVEEPIEEPVEEPIEAPVEEPIEQPVEGPIEEPVEQPVEPIIEEPVEEPVEQPLEEPDEEIIETPVEETVLELVDESIEEPIVEEPIEQPIEQIVEEPVEEPIEEPVEQPAEPVAQTPAEAPAAEPAQAPKETPAAVQPEPAAEPVTEPAPEPEVVVAEVQEPIYEAVEVAYESALEIAPEAATETADPGAEDVLAEASSSLRLNATKCDLGLKETYTGLAVASMPAGSSGDVTWSSDNVNVVKVNAKTGAITGVKKGTAIVTATTADGKKANVSVTVKAAPQKAKFSQKKVTLGAGGMSASLTLKLTKNTASAGTTYASSDEGVVTVDKNGELTSHGVGTAVITAITYNKKKATCTVEVLAEAARAEMPATFALAIGQMSALGAQAYAADGSKTQAGFTYRINANSPNPDCLKIDGVTGSVVAVSKGTAYVSAVTHNGLSCGPCEVTVTAEPTSIKLSAKASIGYKETRGPLNYQLVCGSDNPDCATELTWASSNPNVVAVDAQSGELTGLKKGTATIVVKTHNGLKAKCKVTVKKAPAKIAITPGSATIGIVGTKKFKAKLPKGSAGSYQFSSSNPEVATIDRDGLAMAVSAGETTITVTAYNGVTASAKLTVKAGEGGDDSGDDGKPTDDVQVPASLEKLGIASYQSTCSKDMSNEKKLEYVIYHAQNQLGKPYVYGSGYRTKEPEGFDCSGLVYWCFYKLGIELGESAYKQGYDSHYTKITSMDDLVRGDVICFNTSNDSDLSDHTGIYLGKGYFIHASSGSSKRKVVVQRLYDDSISNDYYKRNFSWGRRILE